MSDQIQQYNEECFEVGCHNSASSHFMDSRKDHNTGEEIRFRGACLCCHCNCKRFLSEKEFIATRVSTRQSLV